MKNRIVTSAFLLILLVCAGTNLEGGETPDTLWENAVSLAERNKNWVPGLMQARMEELDKNSDPEHTYETWTTVSLGEDNEVKYEITRVVEDGQDVTDTFKQKEAEREKKDREKEEEEEEEEESSFSLSLFNPFDPDIQGTIKINPAQKIKIIGQHRCRAFLFNYHQKKKDKKLTGTVFLDESTGIPFELTYTMDPLPRFTKQLNIKVTYTATDTGNWYPETMSFKVIAGFLFIKKRFRNTITFQQYWQKPEDTKEDNT